MNVNWKDENHAEITTDTGSFSVTVRPKENKFVGGRAVKSRLYVSGAITNVSPDIPFNTQVKNVKNVFLPILREFLHLDNLDMKFSRRAGCSCGCSPGFILNDPNIPFDVWMGAR